jgi:hypothetical protein
MKKINKRILDLYYKYDEDLSLLNEPWAKRRDREKVSFEQASVLGMYIDKLIFLKVKTLSSNLRDKTNAELLILEEQIEEDVIDALKRRY